MKKLWLLLALCLLPLTALAAEVPDPEFYFNAGAEKSTEGKYNVYAYAFDADPRAAAEAYVKLLTDSYGFELTDSYEEDELATWRLSNGSEKVRVDYENDGGDPALTLSLSTTLSCTAAETWDWQKSAIAGETDLTLLPDFLQYDSSGKYYYRNSGFSFRTDVATADCVEAAWDYVELLQQRGYTLVESKEKHSSKWDMYKWYFHTGVSGLDKIESDIDGHFMVCINAYYDKGYCALYLEVVDGISMEGYNTEPVPSPDDPFEKNCWYCGYDGKCDTCGGSGQVRKLVPGTREYTLQNCTHCNFGECRWCGGDGRQ